MALNPLDVTRAIEDNYLSYLETVFRINHHELQEQFTNLIRREGRLVRGPIVEAVPPFESADTIEDLIKKGFLCSSFQALNSEKLPFNRPLYKHQQHAIEKIVVEKRNVVVATGTGSGKTEAFIIPIINYLLQQKESSTLGPGVRALLLYPMNALANDQLSRLRDLLKNIPEITFGRYTGDTRIKESEARELYIKTYNQVPLKNELISREQMRASPPHILLTNYAMLEFLLLRPSDHVFFDGKYAKFWHFIVLDEAHTYNGAKGIEMAMLLRRLKDRVGIGEGGKLQCIATSATLSSEESEIPRIASFASQLFGEKFNEQDVITATRKNLASNNIHTFKSFWKPQASVYSLWCEQSKKEFEHVEWETIKRKSVQLGVPENDIKNAISQAKQSGKYSVFLYEVLANDGRVIRLKEELEKGPCTFDALAKLLFDENDEPEERLVELINLTVQAKHHAEDSPLLPAKYHYFVRATEGAYISFMPERKLFITRHEEIDGGDKKYKVFEMAVCRQCGSLFLVGETYEDKSFSPHRQYLKQLGNKYYEDKSNMEVYYLPDLSQPLLSMDISEDEDEEVELESISKDKKPFQREQYKVCIACGAIGQRNQLSPICECGEVFYKDAIRVSSKDGVVYSCPSCRSKSSSGLVWRFMVGNEAAASILASTLYQCQNSTKIVEENEKKDLPRLLIFSDNRQDAAFFAPYLERTHNNILRRRLILRVLQKFSDKVKNNTWELKDLAEALKLILLKRDDFKEDSDQSLENEAWKWVISEFLALDKRNSLEGVGLLGFSLRMPALWKPPEYFLELGYSEEEIALIYQNLLNHFRLRGAINFPDDINPKDEFFAPRNRESFFVHIKDSGNVQGAIFGWLPSRRDGMNSRLDYIKRLLSTVPHLDSSCDVVELSRNLLDKVWKEDLFSQYSIWEDYFFLSKDKSMIKRSINLSYWQLRPTLLDNSIQWYICDTCKNITLHNVRDVCPSYCCTGKLVPFSPNEYNKNNHYYKLYTESEPLRLAVKEHTAQLTSTYASELQKDFIEGKVNALSCSTTFELGVDIGELETVFLRNVPPSPSNYIQRAGRAGRRKSSAALILTYAPLRSHDMYYFQDPIKMVNGKIKSPYFKIANEKIVYRHMYATALAAFWHRYPETFKDVEQFFFSSESIIDKIRDFLDEQPEGLLKSLKNIIPAELVHTIQVEEWEWIDTLLDEENGVLNLAYQQVKNDVESLEKVREELFKEGKKSDHILKCIRTIKKEDIISYLSKHNVLPKYGFPVDVVELDLQNHPQDKEKLELTRDLRYAIAEYAPSSQVVAAGKLWTSRYIKRLPDRTWLKYQYAICEFCECYQTKLSTSEDDQKINDEKENNCKICGKPLGKKRGKFIIPRFGFVADNNVDKPGDTKPERTYTTRIYFSGYANTLKPIEVDLGNSIAVKIIPSTDGKLVVINHAGASGFKVCFSCGYADLNKGNYKNPHKNYWGQDCNGNLETVSLGHEFKTDVLQIRFKGYTNKDQGFWYSLLYGILAGTSICLDIERQDIDGVLFSYDGDKTKPSLVLFDNVPGGAGHVKRIGEEKNTIIEIFKQTNKHLKQCTCGGNDMNSSCYGCLRNYSNQFCHDMLKRGPVIRFLDSILY